MHKTLRKLTHPMAENRKPVPFVLGRENTMFFLKAEPLCVSQQPISVGDMCHTSTGEREWHILLTQRSLRHTYIISLGMLGNAISPTTM